MSKREREREKDFHTLLRTTYCIVAKIKHLCTKIGLGNFLSGLLLFVEREYNGGSCLGRVFYLLFFPLGNKGMNNTEKMNSTISILVA